MFNVELREGMRVETADGKELGRINRFVLNPETNELTHIVVEKGWLLPEDKVVPFTNVQSADEDKVVLAQDIGSFDDLPPFEETYYVRAGERELESMSTNRAAHQPVYPAAPAYYWYPPHGYLGYPAYGLASYSWPRTEMVQNIPAETVPLKEGTNVMSSDGKHIGDIERVLLETGSNRATHFVISDGMFFKDRKLIPASWVSSATEDKIRLHMSSDLLERLPSYEEE
jgi:uncharacterized protein YrrD